MAWKCYGMILGMILVGGLWVMPAEGQTPPATDAPPPPADAAPPTEAAPEQAPAPPPPPRPVQTPEEAAATFEQLYGERVRQVARTPNGQDDLELAVEILGATDLGGLSDALRTVMCQHAYRLTVEQQAGLDIAVSAMRQLEAIVPDKAIEARTTIATLYVARFNTAVRGTDRIYAARPALDALLAVGQALEADLQFDKALTTYRQGMRMAAMLPRDAQMVLRDTITRTTTLADIQKRTLRLEERFKGTQDPALATTIARTYLVDFDRPARAEPWAGVCNDETLKQRVPQAALAQDDVDRQTALQLGQWYEQLAQTAEPHALAAMLLRADGYLAHFAELDDLKDADTLAAQMTHKRVTDRLRQLGITSGNIVGGIDLLPIVIERFGQLMADTRHWQVNTENKTLRGMMTNEDRLVGQPLVIPAEATGDYMFRVQLAVEAEYAVIVLPVGNRLARILYRAHPESRLRGRALNERVPTGGPNRFDWVCRGQFDLTAGPTPMGEIRTLVFDVKTRGNAARIEALVDGEQAMVWEGDLRPFNIGPSEQFELKSQFAIAPPNNGAIRVHQIRASGNVQVAN